MLPQDKIQRNFDRASVTYDRVAVVQKECADQLVEMIQHQCQNLDPQIILDLGAGTGFMTKALLAKYAKSRYYLNDISSQMILKAQKNLQASAQQDYPQQNYPQIDYLLADMTSLAYDNYQPCLSVSNLSFQWVKDFDILIKQVFEQSGFLAFTYLLPDTFQEWAQMFKKLNLIPPIFNYWPEHKWHDFLKSLMPKQLTVQRKKFILTFSNARDFMIYLRELGANQSDQLISYQALKQVLTTYHQPFSITYQVLFVVMERRLT